MIMENSLILLALAVIVVLVIVCFILNIVNTSKINTLMDYAEEGNLTDALKEYYEKVDALSKNIHDASDDTLLKHIKSCQNTAALGLKKTGIVNFNAFDDVTGNLSFCFALLNDLNDGIILTSLYGHNSCNTYIREIKNGETSIHLLEEEKQALEKAKNYYAA
jgi:hypothetical protein